MDQWDRPAPLESLAGGVVQELMALEACQARLDLRETEASTGWPGFQVKRDTGETRDPQDLPEAQERMEREETTERSDPGDCPVSRGLVVCWDQKDLRARPDLLVLPGWMATQDPKETSDLKESRALLDSKETQAHRVSQVPREPSDPQERRDLLENQACQGCQELTAPRVTLGRKGLRAKKATWDPPAPKDPSVIPGPEA